MPNAGPGGEHYFSAAPEAASERRAVRLVLPDLSLELVTDRGVFSGDRVDAGTKLLLAEVDVPADLSGDVLDLGCGYGPIAVTVARRCPAATVWALDVNVRALALAAENAKACGVGDRVQAVLAADIPEPVHFSAIFSNPPIRIGKAALHELLATWLGGEGFAVRRLGSRMGYRLLDVARK